MHCATPLVEDTFLITMVLLKAGGNGSRTKVSLVEKQYDRLLTHTGPLSERHEGTEDAVNVLGTMLDREASLQL